MLIGCLRFTLVMPENESLKGKRAVIQRVRDRLQRRFGVAVAEVGTQDDRRIATLGVVSVSNASAHSHAVLMQVLDYLTDLPLDAELRDVETEIVQAF